MSQSLKKLLFYWLTMSVFPACLDVDREPESHPSTSNGADGEAAASPGAAVRRDQEQAAPPRGRHDVTPNGEERGLDQGPRPASLAASASACFQLNGGGGTFIINATLDLSAYPYTIIGGNISGGFICDSPNWVLTGGTVGNDITINGRHTGTGACADTISIVAPFGPPAGYAGTYGFNGANNFPHRTLFLGFNRPCP